MFDLPKNVHVKQYTSGCLKKQKLNNFDDRPDTLAFASDRTNDPRLY